MVVQAVLGAALLLLAWWLLTDADQPEAGEGRPEPVRPGVAVTHPAPEQSSAAAGQEIHAQVG